MKSGIIFISEISKNDIVFILFLGDQEGKSSEIWGRVESAERRKVPHGCS